MRNPMAVLFGILFMFGSLVLQATNADGMESPSANGDDTMLTLDEAADLIDNKNFDNEANVPTSNQQTFINGDDHIRQGTNEDEKEEDRNGSAAGANAANNKRLWGAAPTAGTVPDGGGSNGGHGSPQSAPFSFVPKSITSHPPPEGFVISARVYIDPDDKLAHLDEDSITLPYWDCGVTGSTTSPLPVKDAAFRHSVTPTTPWSGTDGRHPLLVVALSPLTIETNSGESKSIKSGQVILLEDVIMEGHKLLPLHPHHELQVLFLTLPQNHYHPGKDRVSLYASPKKSRSSEHPCKLGGDAGASKGRGSVLSSRKIRRGLFAMIGLSLSTLAADFFSKTVPLWLAVGVGGTCLVVGGTSVTVMLGEWAVANLELWSEQRRLASQTTATQNNIPQDLPLT